MIKFELYVGGENVEAVEEECREKIGWFSIHIISWPPFIYQFLG